MKDAELSKVLAPLVQSAFAGSDLRKFTIVSGRNHDGEPIINIEVELGDPQRLPGANARADLTRDVLAALAEIQDERFPIITIRFASEEPDEDFYPAPRKRKAGRA